MIFERIAKAPAHRNVVLRSRENMQDMRAEDSVHQELIEYREASPTDREAIIQCLMSLQGFERQHEKDLLPPDEIALQHERSMGDQRR